MRASRTDTTRRPEPRDPTSPGPTTPGPSPRDPSRRTRRTRHTRRTRRRGGATLPAAALLVGLLALVVWAASRGFDRRAEPSTGAGSTERTTHAAAAPAPDAERHALAEPDTASTATPSPSPSPSPSLDFDGYVERLVALGLRLGEAVDDDDWERAATLDDEARDLLTTLHNRFPTADEKALDRRINLVGSTATLTGGVRRKVLVRILADGLEDRWRRHRAMGQPRRVVDSLVTAMLVTIPLGPDIAEDLGMQLLNRKPYLGAAHESPVLHLVETAATERFLMPVATALLTTLWNNLEQSGARSGRSLASLALLFKDDANPSRRLAALERLLTAEDGLYREVAVQAAVASEDAELASALAHAAAAQLSPADAVPILERLVDIGGNQLVGAFLVLGHRDPAILAEVYQQKLADGTAAHLRAELISGIGFDTGQRTREVVEAAFALDPDPAVRERALFALAGCGDAEVAERTLMAALDDPRHAGDPQWVGVVVLALKNLAATGAVNALDRVGQRLRIHPELGSDERRDLEALLARHLPRGGR